MKKISVAEISRFVESNIGSFHDARAKSLTQLKLDSILQRKNPYLFRAKNIHTAQDLVKIVLEAHLSSQEETMFGEFLEKLAIFVAGKVYRGKKSAAEGVDLELHKGDVHYLVSIKSGPNWGNSSQIKKMIDNFKKAKKVLRTNSPTCNIIAINGCCYGKSKSADKGEYYKYCGQQFWQFISNDETFYTTIIEPLGYKAKEKNDEFLRNYGNILNCFTADFIKRFCKRDGSIDWEGLVRFNSATPVPRK